VVAILDHRDIDINDVAVLQFLVGWNAVANDMVDRSADRPWKSAVVQRCGHYRLLVNHEVVADVVELLGGNARFNMRLDHSQYIGGKSPGNAHFFDFFCGFDRNAHKKTADWLLGIRDYGIKRAPTATAEQN